MTYLGHRIDADGLHPLQDRVRAIKEAPTPTSVSTLKSYLGMLTYYSRFLPNLSTTLHPLYLLLRKDAPWKWGVDQEKTFAASKELLTSESCLTHFDSSLELTLACDASAYGLGAVLSHKMPDGSERPIGYASHTLNSSERNYSQLEKEGLSCIFGIKKFHGYRFGRSFELVTDHKPLLGLLKRIMQFPYKPQLESSDGPFSSLATSTLWHSGTQLLMLMPTLSVAYHYQRSQPGLLWNLNCCWLSIWMTPL